MENYTIFSPYDAWNIGGTSGSTTLLLRLLMRLTYPVRTIAMTKPVITPEQQALIQDLLDVLMKKRNITDAFFAAMEKLVEQGVDIDAILKEEYGIDVHSDD